MALKKHGNTWHTHFFVDGERFRQVAPVPLAFPKNNEGTPGLSQGTGAAQVVIWERRTLSGD